MRVIGDESPLQFNAYAPLGHWGSVWAVFLSRTQTTWKLLHDLHPMRSLWLYKTFCRGMNFMHIIPASNRGPGACALVAFWWSACLCLASCWRCLPSCRHQDALSSKGSIHHMLSVVPKLVPNGMSHPSEEPTSLCSHRFGSLDEPSRFAVPKSSCAGSSPEDGWELQNFVQAEDGKFTPPQLSSPHAGGQLAGAGCARALLRSRTG